MDGSKSNDNRSSVKISQQNRRVLLGVNNNLRQQQNGRVLLGTNNNQ